MHIVSKQNAEFSKLIFTGSVRYTNPPINMEGKQVSEG